MLLIKFHEDPGFVKVVVVQWSSNCSVSCWTFGPAGSICFTKVFIESHMSCIYNTGELNYTFICRHSLTGHDGFNHASQLIRATPIVCDTINSLS